MKNIFGVITHSLLLVLGLQVLGAQVLLAGQEGRGTWGIVCQNTDNSILSVKLLDFEEGRVIDNLTIETSDKPWEEQLLKTRLRLVKSSNEFKDFRSYYNEIKARMRYLKSEDYNFPQPTPKDFNSLIRLQDNCKFEALAYWDEKENLLFINDELKAFLTQTEIAGMITHEVYYWIGRDRKRLPNSDLVRKLTALTYCSLSLQELLDTKYWDYIESIFFKNEDAASSQDEEAGSEKTHEAYAIRVWMNLHRMMELKKVPNNNGNDWSLRLYDDSERLLMEHNHKGHRPHKMEVKEGTRIVVEPDARQLELRLIEEDIQNDDITSIATIPISSETPYYSKFLYLGTKYPDRSRGESFSSYYVVQKTLTYSLQTKSFSIHHSGMGSPLRWNQVSELAASWNDIIQMGVKWTNSYSFADYPDLRKELLKNIEESTLTTKYEPVFLVEIYRLRLNVEGN